MSFDMYKVSGVSSILDKGVPVDGVWVVLVLVDGAVRNDASLEAVMSDGLEMSNDEAVVQREPVGGGLGSPGVLSPLGVS